MERNVNYAIVGVFVAAAIAGIIGFVAWIVGSHEARDLARYTVYFNDAVNGLEKGSTVRYRGVNVGQVIAIRLDPSRPDLIKVDIEIDKYTPVYTQTIASLNAQGITGLSYIGLKTSETDKGQLMQQEGEQYPVIKAQPSQLDMLFEDAPKLANNLLVLADQLSKILGKVDRVLNDQNMQHLAETLGHLNVASQKVVTLLDSNTLQHVDAAVHSAGLAAERIERFTGNMEQTLEKIDRVIDAVTVNEATIQQFTGTGLNNVMQLVHETRETVRLMGAFTESLNERPSQIIYQPNYDGVQIEQ